MSDARGKTYRPWEPEHYRHAVHSPEATLPPDALGFFLLDTVPKLDVRRVYAPYEEDTRGAPPFAPTMMGCLVLYAYGVGVFSSRKIAQACERNLAGIAIVGQNRPDLRTISDVRTLHVEACCDVFVQVLRLAGESGLVKVGKVSTDGPTLQGTAARHQAMSYGAMQKEGERVREALEALVTPASPQDAEAEAAWGSRRGEALPAAVARREDRMATIEAAMQRLEARAKAEAEAARQRRAAAEAARQRTGKTRRGRAPKAVDARPDDRAQMSFPDAAVPIMQTNKKGGMIAAMPPPVWMGPSRFSWRVTSRRRATIHSQPCPWPSCWWRTWSKLALRGPKTPRAGSRRCLRPLTAAMTARRRQQR